MQSTTSHMQAIFTSFTFTIALVLTLALPLPALAIPPAHRADLISTLETHASLNALWADFYAYNKTDFAYYLGRADGFLWGAAVIATSPDSEPTPDLLAIFARHIHAATTLTAHYTNRSSDKSYFSGYAEGINASSAALNRYIPPQPPPAIAYVPDSRPPPIVAAPQTPPTPLNHVTPPQLKALPKSKKNLD